MEKKILPTFGRNSQPPTERATLNKKRGLLVSFEGIDRSGKSTQSALLAKTLNDEYRPTIHKRFPDRTTIIGGMIDAYLRSEKEIDDHVIHLLFSANRWELNKEINNHLNQGVNVILDRYTHSGIAYTAAKGYDIAWCKSSDVGLCVPDVVIYLDLSVEETMIRGDFGKERYETCHFQRSVANIFSLLQIPLKDTLQLKYENGTSLTIHETDGNFDIPDDDPVIGIAWGNDSSEISPKWISFDARKPITTLQLEIRKAITPYIACKSVPLNESYNLILIGGNNF